jgi:hypothetical protein
MKRPGHSSDTGLSSSIATDMQESAGIDLQPWVDSCASFSYSSSEMHIAGGKTLKKDGCAQAERGPFQRHVAYLSARCNFC